MMDLSLCLPRNPLPQLLCSVAWPACPVGESLYLSFTIIGSSIQKTKAGPCSFFLTVRSVHNRLVLLEM